MSKIREYIHLFLEKYDNENTRHCYRVDIDDFIKYINENNITNFEIEIETALRYKEYLKSKNYASATITRKLIVIRKVFSFLLQLRYITYNPFVTVNIPKLDKLSSTRNISPDVITKIFELMENMVIREKLILYFLIYHGLRASEICTIKASDFEETENGYTIRIKGKGGKSRIHPTKNEYKNFIITMITEKPKGYLFGSGKPISRMTVYRFVDKIGKLFNVKLHPHQFRHYCITNALSKGSTIKEVKEFAGHSDISTTDRYDRTIINLKDSPIYKMNMEKKEDENKNTGE